MNHSELIFFGSAQVHEFLQDCDSTTEKMDHYGILFNSNQKRKQVGERGQKSTLTLTNAHSFIRFTGIISYSNSDKATDLPRSSPHYLYGTNNASSNIITTVPPSFLFSVERLRVITMHYPKRDEENLLFFSFIQTILCIIFYCSSMATQMLSTCI